MPAQRLSAEISTAMSGLAFRDKFIRRLSEAVELRVMEHSSPLDLSGAPCGRHLYRESAISQADKLRLIERLEAMDGRSGREGPVSACIPAYHHTIEFMIAEEHRVMKICFLCAKIQFEAFGLDDRPYAIFGVLAKFFEELGLSADRDWKCLAAEAELLNPGGSFEDKTEVRPRRPKLP